MKPNSLGNSVPSTTYTGDITSAGQNGVAFKNEPNALLAAVKSYFPSPIACTPITITIHTYVLVLACEPFNKFKLWFAWILSIFCVLDIWALSIKPVER